MCRADDIWQPETLLHHHLNFSEIVPRHLELLSMTMLDDRPKGRGSCRKFIMIAGGAVIAARPPNFQLKCLKFLSRPVSVVEERLHHYRGTAGVDPGTVIHWSSAI